MYRPNRSTYHVTTLPEVCVFHNIEYKTSNFGIGGRNSFSSRLLRTRTPWTRQRLSVRSSWRNSTRLLVAILWLAPRTIVWPLADKLLLIGKPGKPINQKVDLLVNGWFPVPINVPRYFGFLGYWVSGKKWHGDREPGPGAAPVLGLGPGCGPWKTKRQRNQK